MIFMRQSAKPEYSFTSGGWFISLVRTCAVYFEGVFEYVFGGVLLW
jgi:hypothetical protein